ncbi:MAG: TNT antitoxin family protein [Micrococcales bacterium]|nr:TNT antitoxin family protein [Micrococcales bacterium]
MTILPYSPEFIEYAKSAGYKPYETDGEWSLENSGGETRIYLRQNSGMFVLTRADRAESESYIMSAPDATDIERYLTIRMGSSIRSSRRLGFIFTPWNVTDLAPGWVAVVGLDGRWRLTGPDKCDRAVFYDDAAVEFSWFSNVSLADIRSSYLDPDGAPLFVDERWHSVWK